MKPLCIIQARMGSTRLPGKVMMQIKGKPLLGYLLERLERFEPIVACPQDDVEVLARAAKVHGCSDDENDVAERFRDVLGCERCCPSGTPDTFIRLCADSPLLDPALVDAAIALYEPPYLLIRSPVGCVEVCNTKQFLADLPGMNGEEREHVTLTLKAQAPFLQRIYVCGGNHRLVVDTAEDFERLRGVIEKMDRPHTEYGWRECVALL